MNRSIRWSITAALAALTLVVVPAFADPPVTPQANNGRVVDNRVENPNNPDQYIALAVDTHFGVNESGDVTHVSGVARATRLVGALRGQIDIIRVDHGPTAADIDNDYFPSPSGTARDNTPASGFAPSGDRCAGDADPGAGFICIRNPLNSDSDFPGNLVSMTGYSDWFPVVGAAPVVATRVYVSVRWADNTRSTHTLVTNPVVAS